VHRTTIRRVDPQGADALALLREAAIDARALYPDLLAADAPWPTNPPDAPRGVYLVMYAAGADGEADGGGGPRPGEPVACGALRPLGEAETSSVAEVRRMYVLRHLRRGGHARRLLAALEQQALALGYTTLRLETGSRQAPAIALYEACGFVRIPPWGAYIGDPFSVCFEKILT